MSCYVESSPLPGIGSRADKDVAPSEVFDIESRAVSTTCSRIMTVLAGKRDFYTLIRFGSAYPRNYELGARGAGFDICVVLAARN